LNTRQTPVPRHYIFSLEDGTWVVQRGVDRVQELLTGREHSYSSLDISFEIEDVELELLKAQGIIEQYDDSFVWLRESPQNEITSPPSTLQRAPGVAVYYYVQTGLPDDRLSLVQDRLEEIGLNHRYQAVELLGKVIIVSADDEPFSQLSFAEDAQTLIAPALQGLSGSLRVESLRYNNHNLPPEWLENPVPELSPFPPLIRKLEPKIQLQTVVCIDSEPETHAILRQATAELGVELASALTGQEALALIQDVDPALILINLALPDMHGYEIVASVRNDPELAHTPIVILSALNTGKDRILAFSVAKAVDYMPKPFTAEEIRRKVWRILNEYTV
jgi:CheY-like chemotaxis protein